MQNHVTKQFLLVSKTIASWALLAVMAVANEPAASPILQVDEVQAFIGQPGRVLLDVRAPKDYEAGHIPGAVRVPIETWKKEVATGESLRNATFWSQAAGELGLTPESNVVVYGDALPDSARVWWILRYIGVGRAGGRVRLLDGGWKSWTSGGGDSTAEAPVVAVTKFMPMFQRERLAELSDIRAWVSGKDKLLKVLDARAPAEHSGAEVRAARGGHIPNSQNLEWKELLQADGRFKSPRELKAMFAKLGLEPTETVVTYCQSGGRAAAEAIALELAGFDHVKNYYCSWQEWAADPENPAAVITPAEPK